jgi:hypothetical protein
MTKRTTRAALPETIRQKKAAGFLTVAAAAKKAGVALTTVYTWVAKRQVTFELDGGNVWVERTSLLARAERSSVRS